MSSDKQFRLLHNLKGEPRDILISGKTVIAGSVRSQKTATLDALELSRTGKIRAAVHPASLWQWAAPNTDRLYARLESLDGLDFVEHSIIRAGKDKFKKVSSNGGRFAFLENEFVLRGAHDLLRMSPGKVREALVARFGSKLDLAPAAVTDPDMKALWEKYESQCKGESVLETWKLMHEKLRSDILGLGRKIGEEQRSRDSTLAEVTGYTGSDQIVELENALKRAVASESMVGMSELIVKAQQEMAEHVNRLGSLRDKLPAIEVAAAAAKEESQPAEITELEAKAKSLRAQLDAERTQAQVMAGALKLLNANTCKLCDRPGDLQARLNTLTTRLAGISAAKTPKEQEIAQTERRAASLKGEWQSRRTRAANALQEAQQGLNYTENELRTAKTRLNEMQAATRAASTYTGPSSRDLEPKLKKLRQSATAVSAASRMDLNIEHQIIEQGKLKVLQDAVTRKLSRALTELKSTVEETLNSRMPEGYAARLVLDDGACYFELCAPGAQVWSTDTTASGSEKGAFTLAAHLAFSTGLLLLDDESLGPWQVSQAAIQNLLRKLGGLVDEGQLELVMIAGVRSQDVPVDAGFTVVEFGGM